MDSLEISIQASAVQANKALDSLVSKLRQISTQLGIGSNSMGRYAGAINNLTASMVGFKSSGVKGSDFTRIVTGLNRLSTIDSGAINRASGAIANLSRQMSGMGNLNFDSQGLLNIANSISKFGSKTATNATANLPKIKQDLIGFVQGMNGIGSITFDITGLSNLVTAISRLGGKAATNAIPNIQGIGTALRQLMTTLSTAPHVSQNVIQLANALANLARNGSRVSTASHSMQNGLRRYSTSAKTATKHSKGLASAIGMFYARCFLAIRAIKALWRAIKGATDYIETLNYFDAAWRQVADHAVGQWKQAGYDSAEEYANSFSERSKELTGKMTGFQPDSEGNLISTGIPSLGINPQALMNYQATFGQMASSMGVTSENALKLSNALTMIGADLASVKNLEFDDVWRDMSSGLVGMSRTLDKYGVNIRNVNLQQKLNELGIKANIKALNQNDKALLRIIILLQSTKYAWGDMARTIDQPANQLRLLKASFSNLARTLGNLFLPIISKVLPYINALVIALQRLFSWIGGLFGIKASDFTTSIGGASADMGDFAEEAGDAADSLDDAAGSAKKLKGNLAGWDELENRTSNDNAGGGGGAAGGAGGIGELDAAFDAAIAEYQAAWDAAFAEMENKANEIANRICDAFKRGDYYGIGKYIGTGITNALESINWDSVYSVARRFGTGFAEFLNGLISPELFSAVGATFAGALNTAIYNALSFGQTFNWKNLGNSIASGINRFFSTFDFSSAGLTLTTFATGVLDALIAAIENIDWNIVGARIGTFLVNLDFAEIGGKVGTLIWKAINAGLKLWGSAFSVAPVETTILTAFGLLSFTGLGKIVATKIAASIAAHLGTRPVITVISAGLNALFGSNAARSALVFMFPKTAAVVSAVSTFFTGTLLPALTGGLAAIGTTIIGAVTALASTLGISVAAAGGIVIAAIVAAVATIIYTVTHWEEVKEFWTVKVPEWWNGTALPFFQSIPSKMSAIWENVKKAASEKWGEFLNYMRGIPENVGEIISSIGEWFNELPGKIGYALGYALGTVASWGVDLYQYLSQKIPEIVSGVATWFSELPGKIYNAIITFLGRAEEWASHVLTTFKVKSEEIIGNVVMWFSELPGKVYDTIIKIKDSIETWTTNTIGFFKEKVPEIVDNVIEFFKALPQKIITIGEDAVKGLWKGIENLTDWLGTNIGNFCKGVINGFKAGFDEHSPSKEAFKIGDYFTLGLKNGILDKFGTILSDVKDFSRKVTSIDFNAPLINTSYSLKRNLEDTITVKYATPSYNKNSLSSEMEVTLKGIQDLLSETRRQNELLEEINQKEIRIGDSDIFDAVRREDRKKFKSTGRPAWSGI